MGSIVTATAVLRAKSQDEGLTPAMSRIQSSAERMSRMIDQLLDFTRIRLGEGLPIRPTAVDARDLCERVVTELQGTGGDEVALELDGDTATQWDADRISQLLSNLVANALQHRESHSRISVRIDRTDGRRVASARAAGHAVGLRRLRETQCAALAHFGAPSRRPCLRRYKGDSNLTVVQCTFRSAG